MKTAISPTAELDAIAAAEQPLRELAATLEAELKELESRRRTAFDFDHPGHIRQTLRQLEQGVSLGTGMDPRLYALLSAPGMARFRFRAPGLAPLARLRAKLLAAEQVPAEPGPLLKFRYIGPKWKHSLVQGEWLQPGDVVELTAQSAAQSPHRFEPV